MLHIPAFLAYTWISITFLVFLGFTLIAVLRYRERNYVPDRLPSVLVILPCKGIDYRFEENLSAIKDLDYPDYSVIAVIDTPDDPAADYLRNAGIEMILSSSVCTRCSGKVRALSTVFERHSEHEIYAVVDSDVKVGKDWLKKLIPPLLDEKTGVSTTFPVFVPEGGIWSVVKAVWGMVGTGMMQSRLTRFVWGGSMAFRSELLDESAIEEFKSMVSDDVAIMRISRRNGKEIAYVKKASPLIHSPDDFGTFFEWANRQTALSVSGSKDILKFGFAFYLLQIFLLVSSLCLAVFIAVPLALFLIPVFITATRNSINVRNRKTTAFAISFLMPFLYLVNLIIASRMDSITWRGSEYELN